MPPIRRCGRHALPGKLRDAERERQREIRRADQRRDDPARRELYGDVWRRHSAARRAATPWCERCGATASLTVDHPTDAVLCRPCHGRLEAMRRAVRARG